jgi:hypothetical protein
VRIILFTDNKNCNAAFDVLRRSKTHTIEDHPTATLKSVMDGVRHDHFVYLDITGLSMAAIRARLKLLGNAVSGRFGVVDRNSSLRDVAEAFQRGASDYVDARLLRDGFTTARLARVLEFAMDGESGPDPLPMQVAADFYPSGNDWNEVEQGQEYTFQMLYVALDHMKELRRKSSEDLLRTLRRTLQSILTRTFAGVSGRIWVWKEDDGVLLCPFDGERVTALIPAMRLVLNRVLMNIEQFSVTTPISWRMGLHIGNIPYEASGQTSGIVSEALNFIFHLGERAVRPGQLAVTESAMALAPEKVRPCFVKGSEFESMRLYLLRDLT